ncbi:hypothetical protein [Nocardioides sp.]|uniref:hypothetical protein n=1 Tax=Nocardioides sp. TaxID=35761 RepID=UPI002716B377|nr:hypothetical protein [Nocardioides sp.]MDO9457320.1 hypothetical protein [Nocardioides sp.]
MYSSRLRRAAAAVALATAASVISVGAAGTATAAPVDRGQQAQHAKQAQRFSTKLTINAPDVADTEGRAAVRGRLTARGIPLAQRPVRLLVKREGATRWALGRIEQTNRQGRVVFRVLPPAETAYKLAFFGTANFKPSRSGTVVVAARDTEVSIAVTPGVVDPGGSAVVSGVVTDEDVALAGAPVELRARKAGTKRAFEPIATAVSGTDGSVSFTVTPTRATAYVLVARKTATSQAARSKVATIAVKSPTRIAVRARTIGETFSVVGFLYGRGDGLAGRKVTLQEQAAGATGWTDVKSGRTARDGYVDFRRPAVEGTSYRLSFAGTTRLGASVSRTVVV